MSAWRRRRSSATSLRDFAAPSPIQAMKARSKRKSGAAQPDEEAPYVLGVALVAAHFGVAGDGVAVPAEDHLSFLCARWSGQANDGLPTGRQDAGSSISRS